MRRVKNVLHWVSTHKKFVIPTVIILIILIGIFFPKKQPVIPTQVIHFTTVTQMVSVSGTINAKNSINLTFPIGGTISFIGVKGGDVVKKSQVIATLDARTAEKSLKAALISYSLARNTFDQNIVNNNNIQNPMDALSDNMKRILQNNQYNLDQAVNSVELQDLARQESILLAPIAGLVTRADTEVAGGTAAGTNPTFTITDPQSIVFDMDVDEADISKVSVGQMAKVILDAYPDHTLSLKITSIDFVSHTTSNGANAYTVEVRITDNPNYRYRVGMNGDADIVTAEKSHVLSVPLSALENDTYVYVKTGKTYIRHKLTLGLQSDTDAEVRSGLHDGDVISLDPSAVVTNKLASGTSN